VETWKMAQDIEKQDVTLEVEGKGMSEKEIYKQALDKWGATTQILMLFEEMSELQNAMCKVMRGRASFLETAEEIADVEIMIGQMKTLFDIEKEVENWKKNKIERLAKRLKD